MNSERLDPIALPQAAGHRASRIAPTCRLTVKLQVHRCVASALNADGWQRAGCMDKSPPRWLHSWGRFPASNLRPKRCPPIVRQALGRTVLRCPNRAGVRDPCRPNAWLFSARCCSRSWYVFCWVLAEKVVARSRFCGRCLRETGSRPCQKQGPYNGPHFGTAYTFFNKRSQNRDRFSAPVLDQLLPL